MFEVLDRQTTLTGNQKKIIAAAIIGDALEFFDYFLIGFVLAFLIGPWKLTFGQSAIVLMTSGIGAIIGAYVWGWIADRIGRRKVFIGTVLNFSIATGLLYFTPDNGWVYLTVMRFFVGCRRRRPLLRRPAAGAGVHADLQARLGRRTGDLRHSDRRRPRRRAGRLHAAPTSGACCSRSACCRRWSSCWSACGCRNRRAGWRARAASRRRASRSPGRCRSIPSRCPCRAASTSNAALVKTNWFDLFKYPRSLLVSWLGNAGAQTGVYGVALWAPTLFVLLLKVTPQEAAKMMILLTVTGFIGRLSFSWLSEKIGRRNWGGLLGFGAGILIILAGYNYDALLFGLSAFWLILAAAMFFVDGGFAIVGPYAAEIWPSHLKTTGMGSAYGFGGIGKIIGPVGLALIVGSSNYLKPDVPLPQIPTAFLYLGCWFLMAGVVYYFFGLETKGKSLQEIDRELGVATA